MAVSVLDAAGIAASVADEHLVSMAWTYSNAIGGVKVLVPEEHVGEAKALLETDAEILEPSYLDESAIDQVDAAETCP